MKKIDGVNAFLLCGWALMVIGLVLSHGIATCFGNSNECRGLAQEIGCLFEAVFSVAAFGVLASMFLWCVVCKTVSDSDLRMRVVISGVISTVAALGAMGGADSQLHQPT